MGMPPRMIKKQELNINMTIKNKCFLGALRQKGLRLKRQGAKNLKQKIRRKGKIGVKDILDFIYERPAVIFWKRRGVIRVC
jgi:hypothetical protein